MASTDRCVLCKGGQHAEVHVLRQAHLARLRSEDGATLISRRQRTAQRLVETAWAKQRRVEEVRPTSCSEHVDALERFYTVQLRQELIHHTVSYASAIVSSV